MRWKVYVILLFLFVVTILELLSIGLILPFISLIIEPKSLTFFGKNLNIEKYINDLDREKVLLYGLIIFNIIIISKNLVLFFLNYLASRFYLSVNVELISSLFKKYMSQDYLFHVYSDSSAMLRNIVHESTFLAKKNLKVILDLILNSVILIGLSIMILILRPTEASIILGVFILFFCGYSLIFKRLLKKWGKKRMEYDGLILKYTQQALKGFREIKLYQQESFFEKILIKKVFRKEILLKYINIIAPIPRYIIEILIVLILTFVALKVSFQEENLQELIPEIALLAAIAFKLFPIINKIVINSQALRYGYASVQALWEEHKLQIKSNIQEDSQKIQFKKNIILEKISFKYPKTDNIVLDQIDLKFLKGNIIGIVGKSGEGKSTLLDLVSGIIEPTSGSVKVDSQDISKSLGHWRKKIGYVSQGTFFLDDTVRNNITFGKFDYFDEKNFNRALKLSNVEEFLPKLTHGVDTIIGEDGVKLSGGQKQRISIARAIYRNPEVIIFDEATSALDETNEKKIIDIISNLKGLVTVFISTHKSSLLSHCDVKFKIEDKKVITIN